MTQPEPRLELRRHGRPGVLATRTSPASTGRARPRPTSRSADGRYGVFAHDWRVEPAATWMSGSRATRCRSIRSATRRHAARTPPYAARGPEFADAVRQALRDYTRPDRLATNPLLRSRLVVDAAGPKRSAAALQSAAPRRDRHPDGQPQGRRSSTAPSGTPTSSRPRPRKQAAELLDLPFNTYRYQLANGIERVTEYLRQQERGIER